MFNFPHVGLGIKDQAANVEVSSMEHQGGASSVDRKQIECVWGKRRGNGRGRMGYGNQGHFPSHSVTAIVSMHECLHDATGHSCSCSLELGGVQKNRQLILGFLLSAAPLLSATGEIHVALKTCQPYTRWNVTALAHQTGLLKLRSTTPFRPSLYPGCAGSGPLMPF